MSSIAHRFGVTVSVAHGIIHDTLNILIPHMISLYIQWPNFAMLKIIGLGFHLKSPNLPPEIGGSLDSREIPICPPKEDSVSYFNRKQFYSLKLQAVVDHKARFMDTFIGWPGRSHDSRAFSNSPLYHALENDALPYPFFIVADSAYPLKKNIITPFKQRGGNAQQRRFNKAVSRARIQVECAFGQLANRFRRLQHVNCRDIGEICKITLAGCTLHNFCKDHNEPFDEVDVVDDENDDDEPVILMYPGDINGINRRNELMNLFA